MVDAVANKNIIAGFRDEAEVKYVIKRNKRYAKDILTVVLQDDFDPKQFREKKIRPKFFFGKKILPKFFFGNFFLTQIFFQTKKKSIQLFFGKKDRTKKN